MTKSNEQAQITRQQNMERKAAADAQSAEYRAQIMGVLAEAVKDPAATVKDKLRAAELAIELKHLY